MKYIVMLSDGMAGRPLAEIDGMTTLEAAKTPVLDRLAKTSEIGLASMVPEGMAPGSDTANLAVMGYDPKIYYTGRSPLEALSIGVDMKDTDVSFRCNIVTLSDEDCAYEDRTIIDHSSDEISTADAAILLEALKEGLKREGYEFYVGTSYRHLLIRENGEMIDLVPPHDVLTQRIGEHLPTDKVLREMMEKSFEILNHHPLNEERAKRGLNKANSIWFWGAGTKPCLTSFEEKTGRRGVMISAVDLLKGIAIGAGMKVVFVEGADGTLHTNYEGKANAAINAFENGKDLVYIHVEAPDECGHRAEIENKVLSIEKIDSLILKPLYDYLSKCGEDFKILTLPDHPTPIEIRTHSMEPVPFMIYSSKEKLSGVSTLTEQTATDCNYYIKNGTSLMELLTK